MSTRRMWYEYQSASAVPPVDPLAADLVTAVSRAVRAEARLEEAMARVPSYTGDRADADYHIEETVEHANAAEALLQVFRRILAEDAP